MSIEIKSHCCFVILNCFVTHFIENLPEMWTCWLKHEGASWEDWDSVNHGANESMKQLMKKKWMSRQVFKLSATQGVWFSVCWVFVVVTFLLGQLLFFFFLFWQEKAFQTKLVVSLLPTIVKKHPWRYVYRSICILFSICSFLVIQHVFVGFIFC